MKVFKGLALTDRSNAAESVRRQVSFSKRARQPQLTYQAFVCYLNTYVLFSPKSSAPAAKAATLKMEDETQHRLGGSFQAAVERYASDLEEVQASQSDENSELDSGFRRSLKLTL